MNRVATVVFLALYTALTLFISPSCRCVRAESEIGPGDTLTRHASLLHLVDHRNGIVSARVYDPWNEGAELGTYILADRHVPDDSIPTVEGATVIRVPVESALVFSSVHTAGFEELDALGAVTGVADGNYFSSPVVRHRIDNGTIVDVGNSMAPSLEKIIDLSPEAALVSPYENSGNGVLDKTGIAVIRMADYMEPTPLGRAEWILLIGALTGRLDQARQIYADVEKKYTGIVQSVSGIAERPLVISELPFNGVWYQPGGASYVAAMIRDAGGRPLLDDDSSAGSVQMDIASVYDRGVRADVWLIKTPGDLSARTVGSTSRLLRDIRAFQTDNIWNANTVATSFYDDIAFHPERILSDMAVVFHPRLRDSIGSPRYFVRVR